MIKKKIIIPLLILIFGITKAQEKTNAFSLQQAIDFSIKNSPNFLNSELDEKMPTIVVKKLRV